MLARSIKYWLLYLFLLPEGVAQDLHFSQFQFASVSVNPAIAGAGVADLRFSSLYRKQWGTVPIPYETFTFAFDQKMGTPRLKTNNLGLGAYFRYDQAGDGQLSWGQLGLSAAYSFQMSTTQQVSLGIGIQAGQRSLDERGLFFGDQFNGDVFDPTQASAEAFERISAAYFSTATGVLWQAWHRTRRHHVEVGLSASHLNRPSIRFLEEAALALPLLWHFQSTGTLQISDKTDVLVEAYFRLQGPYREVLAGLGSRIHLKEGLALDGRLLWRVQDALIPQVRLLLGNWQLGLAYDVNLSPFQVATLRMGGPEIGIQYLIYKVKPPEVFKSCPIF
ncbi:MAG TPA: PorP/SprF family type IX secretion system membrane protein [Saprospiraceae bacterium]|nr:PorP/SprF family type IX secretion system membrane protein [Saprospiraceae bacterium]HMQ84478.1 PorP/SprF family type IX secretion system membrane protein [Saprospiraceae bacterium]